MKSPGKAVNWSGASWSSRVTLQKSQGLTYVIKQIGKSTPWSIGMGQAKRGLETATFTATRGQRTSLTHLVNLCIDWQKSPAGFSPP